MNEQPVYYDTLNRIHKVITRGLDVTIDKSLAFAKTGFPDKAIATGFFRYVKSCLITLYAHHVTEDEVAFPFFQRRVPSLRLDGLIMQHQQMVPHRETIKALIEKAADEPETDLSVLLTKVAESATNLRTLWLMHINAEESYFTSESITSLQLSKEEQANIIRQTVEYNQKYCHPAAWVLPFLLYNLRAHDRAKLAENMPPQMMKVLVPIVWKNEWAPMKPFLFD
ncbi:MAG: hemerythrin domain-containing protein [Chloroflexota bacterium]